MARNVQPFAVVQKREAVRDSVARILIVDLPKLPRSSEVRRFVALTGYLADRIFETFAAEKRREQLRAFRQTAVAHERILQFADACMRFAVGYLGRETHEAVRLERDRQAQGRVEHHSAADKRRVADGDFPALPIPRSTGDLDSRRLLAAQYRHFLLFVASAPVVEIEPPELRSSRPVVSRVFAYKRL